MGFKSTAPWCGRTRSKCRQSSCCFAQSAVPNVIAITKLEKNMSRLVVSKICFRNILFCCFSCSVLVVLFVNRLSLNDYSPAVLANLLRTELSLEFQQLERQKLLLEKCRETIAAANNQPKRNVTTPVIFKVDDRHRVMYCDVPKVKNNYRQNKSTNSGDDDTKSN
jgi:hypothetical protein